MNLQKASDLAYLSKIAYDDKAAVKKETTRLGYQDFAWFDYKSTQAFAVHRPDKDEIILCFRGTEKKSVDIRTDLRVWPKSAPKGGLVHFGFSEALDEVYGDIVRWIKTLKIGDNYTITCTGHSLGAALATLIANRLDTHARVLYTFGSPLVGDRTFVKQMNSKQIEHYRFVNNNDIVTWLPPFVLPSIAIPTFTIFRHHGERVYINFYGNIRKMTTWQKIKDQWRGRRRAFQKGQPFDGIYDHSIGLYYEKIKNFVSGR